MRKLTEKYTTQEFIDRAREVHGNKYGYDLVVYQTSKCHVSIRCHEHGTFKQIPARHLSGGGCHKCAGVSKLTTDEFIAKSRARHGDRYGYALAVYQGSQNSVLIHCTEHGVFEQRPNRHLMGAGCPKCGVQRTSESKLLNTNIFVNRASNLHKNKYDYSLSSYKTNYEKLKIICKEHGVFLQTPNNHLMGNGCPGCAESGFDQTRPSFIYLLRSECGRYSKIGITNKPSQRHAQLRRKTPFSFYVIECVQGVGSLVSDVETIILDSFEPACFDCVFDGSTEWLLWSPTIRLKLLTLMKEGHSHVQKDTESTAG